MSTVCLSDGCLNFEFVVFILSTSFVNKIFFCKINFYEEMLKLKVDSKLTEGIID